MEITDLNGNLLNFPPGYVFLPSDQQLVVNYLRRKANSLRHYNFIPQITNVFLAPWDLPGDLEERRHFFSTRTRNSSRIVDTGCGYWKHDVDEDSKVLAPCTNSVIGIRKSWVFYSEEGNETQWIMHEFSLVRAFDLSLPKKKVVEVGKLNVYRIYRDDEDECNDGEYCSDLDQEENSGEIAS